MEDPVGIRTAQSILMSATQGSLSHFHTAGMEASGGGLQSPSVADAMDSRYNSSNTSATFVIDDRNRALLQRTIVGKKLLWFVTRVQSNITELPDAENVWYDALGEEMYDGVVLRLYIDYARIASYNFTLYSLASVCFKRDIEWRVSPDFMGMIDVNITDNYMPPWLSRMDTLVCGTPEIVSCDVKYNMDHQFVAVTRGSSILAISRAHGVSKVTIISNNVADVARHLGIEAAACALNRIIGSDVLSDFMTRTGSVLPFFKYSPEVPRKGVLTSMSFERPRNDIKAAMSSGAWDKHASVYAHIMTGIDPLSGFTLLPERQ